MTGGSPDPAGNHGPLEACASEMGPQEVVTPLLLGEGGRLTCGSPDVGNRDPEVESRPMEAVTPPSFLRGVCNPAGVQTWEIGTQ